MNSLESPNKKPEKETRHPRGEHHKTDDDTPINTNQPMGNNQSIKTARRRGQKSLIGKKSLGLTISDTKKIACGQHSLLTPENSKLRPCDGGAYPELSKRM